MNVALTSIIVILTPNARTQMGVSHVSANQVSLVVEPIVQVSENPAFSSI